MSPSMSPLTTKELLGIAPSCKSPQTWLKPLTDAMQQYEIITFNRMAAFLAQLAHESGEFRWTREVWGPTDAQRRYEMRADLGNDQPGDGHKYLGRGLIQLTGKDNYRKLSDVFSIDFLDAPDLLEMPQYAALSAGWFWAKHGCNLLADSGSDTDFAKITRAINGGLNGLISRQSYWRRAKKALTQEAA